MANAYQPNLGSSKTLALPQFRFEMPVPSSSKLRPGYSLNFRHTAAPAADEAAARLPGFTVHIGLGESNDVLMIPLHHPSQYPSFSLVFSPGS